jgi:hypothetical protein
MASEFQVALAACCTVCKANSIPEVEAVKRLLDPILRARLDQIVADLLRTLQIRLGRLPTFTTALQRRQLLDAVLTALLAEIEFTYTLPFDQNTAEQVREAVDALLAAGGSFSGAPDPTAALLPISAHVAEQELVLLLQQAVVNNGSQIRQLLGEFLTDPDVRAAQSGLGAASVFDQQVARLIGPGEALGATIDSWAYRTFNVGIVAAAATEGVIGFRLQASLDGRETAFCRWVHGRTVPLSRVRRQMQRHREAVLAGDRAAMLRSFPFLDPETALRGSPLEFEQFFRRAGLPGYHFGCRTVSKPVRE